MTGEYKIKWPAKKLAPVPHVEPPGPPLRELRAALVRVGSLWGDADCVLVSLHETTLTWPEGFYAARLFGRVTRGHGAAAVVRAALEDFARGHVIQALPSMPYTAGNVDKALDALSEAYALVGNWQAVRPWEAL